MLLRQEINCPVPNLVDEGKRQQSFKQAYGASDKAKELLCSSVLLRLCKDPAHWLFSVAQIVEHRQELCRRTIEVRSIPSILKEDEPWMIEDRELAKIDVSFESLDTQSQSNSRRSPVPGLGNPVAQKGGQE